MRSRQSARIEDEGLMEDVECADVMSKRKSRGRCNVRILKAQPPIVCTSHYVANAIVARSYCAVASIARRLPEMKVNEQNLVKGRTGLCVTWANAPRAPEAERTEEQPKRIR
jgi:hypothetical protein